MQPDFEALFQAAPSPYLVLGPELAYLTKPIEVRALLGVVDRVLAPAPMAARSDGG